MTTLPQRIRAGLLALSILVLPGDAAWAQDASPEAERRPADITLDTATVEAGAPVRIGGKPPAGPCVAVDIAGHRAGHLDCASETLEEAARTAQRQARSAIDTPVISATSPDVRTGVASQSATRQRMGNTFGTSVHPQRPNRVFAPPRGGAPRP